MRNNISSIQSIATAVVRSTMSARIAESAPVFSRSIQQFPDNSSAPLAHPLPLLAHGGAQAPVLAQFNAPANVLPNLQYHNAPPDAPLVGDWA